MFALSLFCVCLRLFVSNCVFCLARLCLFLFVFVVACSRVSSPCLQALACLSVCRRVVCVCVCVFCLVRLCVFVFAWFVRLRVVCVIVSQRYASCVSVVVIK